MYFSMPTDINGINRELEAIQTQRSGRNDAAVLTNLFNNSGVTSVKYQGKNGRGVLLESTEQLEDLKRLLGPEFSNPDQLSVVVNLRSKAWEKLQDLGSASPRELKQEQKAWEALTSEKIQLELKEEQVHDHDHVPARRTKTRAATKWYTENDDGDIVLVDLDTLEADDEVCASGSEEWVTAAEAGLVAPPPKRRRPAKRRKTASASVDAEEIAEDSD